MGRHVDAHDQVAGGTAVAAHIALAPDGNGLAIVDACRDLHADLLGLPQAAAAAAGLAGLVDDLALAPAVGTDGAGGHGAEHGPLLHAHLTGAVALGADLGCGTLGAAGAATGVAGLNVLDGDLLLTAEGGLLQSQV